MSNVLWAPSWQCAKLSATDVSGHAGRTAVRRDELIVWPSQVRGWERECLRARSGYKSIIRACHDVIRAMVEGYAYTSVYFQPIPGTMRGVSATFRGNVGRRAPTPRKYVDLSRPRGHPGRGQARRKMPEALGKIVLRCRTTRANGTRSG